MAGRSAAVKERMSRAGQGGAGSQQPHAASKSIHGGQGNLVMLACEQPCQLAQPQAIAQVDGQVVHCRQGVGRAPASISRHDVMRLEDATCSPCSTGHARCVVHRWSARCTVRTCKIELAAWVLHVAELVAQAAQGAHNVALTSQARL